MFNILFQIIAIIVHHMIKTNICSLKRYETPRYCDILSYKINNQTNYNIRSNAAAFIDNWHIK